MHYHRQIFGELYKSCFIAHSFMNEKKIANFYQMVDRPILMFSSDTIINMSKQNLKYFPGFWYLEIY